MAADTKIGWATHTFNFWHGCQAVSPACDHCYAEDWAKRYGKPWGPHGARVRTSEQNWKSPYRWNKWADEWMECSSCQWAGRVKDGDTTCPECHSSGLSHAAQSVFTLSLGDFFDNKVDRTTRADAWRVIHDCDRLHWLILTKLPQNINGMLPPDWGDGWQHVRFGVTVENQAQAEIRLPHVLNVVSKNDPFVSAEPLLGFIDLTNVNTGDGILLNALEGRYSNHVDAESGIGWVITGHESGKHRRPTDAADTEDLMIQCRQHKTPFFYKQSVNSKTGKVDHYPTINGELHQERPTFWTN